MKSILTVIFVFSTIILVSQTKKDSLLSKLRIESVNSSIVLRKNDSERINVYQICDNSKSEIDFLIDNLDYTESSGLINDENAALNIIGLLSELKKDNTKDHAISDLDELVRSDLKYVSYGCSDALTSQSISSYYLHLLTKENSLFEPEFELTKNEIHTIKNEILISEKKFWMNPNIDYIDFKNKLDKKNVNLIVEYRKECYSDQPENFNELENCSFDIPYYLLWIDNSKYYIKKFSNCSTSRKKRIKKSLFLETVSKNLDEIKKSEILPYVSEIYNCWGPPNPSFDEYDALNYCETKLVFHNKNVKIKKNINHFYLDTEQIDENSPSNDNYKINQKSILNTLIKLLEKEIN